MKNIIYVVFLLVTINGFAQSTIEQDALFLKYEQEYLKMGTSNHGRNYELANKNFYSNFADHKDRNKFIKNSNKENWLNKNYDKAGFSSANEALNSYNNMVTAKDALDKEVNNVIEIRNNLLKKYDATLVSETIQRRFKANK